MLPVMKINDIFCLSVWQKNVGIKTDVIYLYYRLFKKQKSALLLGLARCHKQHIEWLPCRSLCVLYYLKLKFATIFRNKNRQTIEYSFRTISLGWKKLQDLSFY